MALIMWQDFRLTQFEVTLQFLSNCQLSAFKGITLAGGISYTLKSTICIDWHDDCQECNLKDRCKYPALFPDAIILTPINHQKRDYQNGERLVFQFGLMGDNQNHLPDLVFSLLKLGKRGLGSDRGKFIVEKIVVKNPLTDLTATLYHHQQGMMPAPLTAYEITTEHIKRESQKFSKAEQITLAFETPTAIFAVGRFQKLPTFPIFFKALAERIKPNLSQNGHSPPFGAEEITLVSANVRSHQLKQMTGFTGEITYQGNFAPFGEWLVLGNLVQVGKYIGYGFGKYSMIMT